MTDISSEFAPRLPCCLAVNAHQPSSEPSELGDLNQSWETFCLCGIYNAVHAVIDFSLFLQNFVQLGLRA